MSPKFIPTEVLGRVRFCLLLFIDTTARWPLWPGGLVPVSARFRVETTVTTAERFLLMFRMCCLCFQSHSSLLVPLCFGWHVAFLPFGPNVDASSFAPRSTAFAPLFKFYLVCLGPTSSVVVRFCACGAAFRVSAHLAGSFCSF